MNKRCAKTHWIVAGVLLLAAPSAFAQSMYRCSNGTGGSTISDRPCRSGDPAALRSIGPVQERPSYGHDYTPTMAKAPDILPYLSPECAEMNDAVRTGPARGLKSAAMSELFTNYRLRCGEDEQAASQKMRQARSDERQQRHAVQAAQNAEVQRVKLSVEQCNEMLRILASRRQRVASMTPGERHDLELFEANYRVRCKS